MLDELGTVADVRVEGAGAVVVDRSLVLRPKYKSLARTRSFAAAFPLLGTFRQHKGSTLLYTFNNFNQNNFYEAHLHLFRGSGAMESLCSTAAPVLAIFQEVLPDISAPFQRPKFPSVNPRCRRSSAGTLAAQKLNGVKACRRHGSVWGSATHVLQTRA